jgi:hypothetical protein
MPWEKRDVQFGPGLLVPVEFKLNSLKSLVLVHKFS